MTRLKPNLLGLAAAVAVLGAAPIVAQIGNQNQPEAAINDPNLVFPRIRIVHFQGGVARFDTATGELARFRGELTGDSARGTWARLARPVSDEHSGFLDLRRVGNAIFMVDLVTGQTWLLRNRDSIASWIAVNDF